MFDSLPPPSLPTPQTQWYVLPTSFRTSVLTSPSSRPADTCTPSSTSNPHLTNPALSLSSELRKRNEQFAKKVGTKSKLLVVAPLDKKTPIAPWIVWTLAFVVGGPRASASREGSQGREGADAFRCTVIFQFVQALVDAFATPALKSK